MVVVVAWIQAVVLSWSAAGSLLGWWLSRSQEHAHADTTPDINAGPA